jgi:N-hydroxyarylamine O-acetyltransferase
MDVNSYLERIDYHGSISLNAETLKALQVAHLLTVPFENLSIHAKEPILLETEALFEKIVNRKRGGFCYEANGLFAALLSALGFEVQMVSAEVARADGSYGPNFDHMALVVTLEKRWLVDVGFGDSFHEPLLLDARGEQRQGRRTYKIISDAAYLIIMQRELGEDWKPQYRFTLQSYEFPDFAEMCFFHQTSPESHFTQKRICSRTTKDGGRLTLSDMRFISTNSQGKRSEQIFSSQTDYDEALREHFGIVMMS